LNAGITDSREHSFKSIREHGSELQYFFRFKNHFTQPHADRRSGEGRTYLLKPVGFRNFSQVTPQLSLAWALQKPPRGNGGATN
jgi:hypothetical protein